MSILLDSLFSAVAFGHFGVDILNGSVGVLLAYLSGPLGMNNTALGAASTAYHVTGSLAQPFFGYLTDRVGPRWVVAGGVLWIGVCFSLAAITPGLGALAFLISGSLGSGAFHPAGTMQATLIGRRRFDGRETSSTSYFFLLGQAGLFLGPLLGGLILGFTGPRGWLLLTVPALPIAWNAATRLRFDGFVRPKRETVSLPPRKFTVQIGWMALIVFALLAALRAMVQQNMNTFVPKYLIDLGYAPEVYGLITALFMGGSALGNVMGGNLADRFGGRRVAMITLSLCALPLVALPSVEGTGWLYALVPLTGALSGASHSIVVVYAQRILPGGMATASGTILGFMFGMGALGTWWSGYLADLWGIPAVFWLSAGLTVVAAFSTGVLKDTIQA